MKKSEEMVDKLSKILMPVSEKMMGLKFIAAISETMQAVLPVILLGSFALLASSLDIGNYQKIIGMIPNFITICNAIFSVTVGLFSLYVLILLPYMYGRKIELKEHIASIPVAIIVFLLFTPQVAEGIPMEWLGTKGLFSAIIIGIMVPRAIQAMLAKHIRIRLPKGIPPFVEDGFSILLPALFVMVPVGILGTVLNGTSLGSFHNIIYIVLQLPLKKIGLSLFGHTLIYALAALTMFCGIHAGTIGYLIVPLAAAADLENLEAYHAGAQLPNIITQGFSNLTLPGMAGCLLIPAIIMVLFCKSKRYKSLGKLSIIPAFFGIGEPVLFGVPVMLNPILLIPMIVTIIFNNILSYMVIALGIIGRFTGVYLPWTTPPILYPLLASSTPIAAAAFNMIEIVLDILIWMPFMRIMDKKACMEEEQGGNE